MSDLIERLRKPVEGNIHDERREAADELERRTAEVSMRNRDLDILRGNADRWEKLAIQYKREIERLTAERDALQDSYEGEIENRLSVSRSHEKYVTENERLRAALEDLRGSAQGKDDGWIIDAVDEALQGDSDE